ncbi:MAG: chromate efflux transporter [Gammaproteobacteria bacterium]
MPGGAGTPREVLRVFLVLGLSAFGGPIAHLGYYRHELVERRRWVGEAEYAALVALCQFLPGPASSQVGFCLGWLRAGPFGALAAFVAFTLPSALLMFLFALLVPRLGGPLASAALHGLALVAVAVVAHGVLGMARQLTPDLPRRAVAVAATGAMLAAPAPALQLLVVAAGALAGLLVCRDTTIPQAPGGGVLDPRRAWLPLALCAGLLVALPLVATTHPLAAVAAIFYRAGALVFGGGHVVLPLLEQSVVAPRLVAADTFVAGYGAAQAVPGPLFSFAAFLGASLPAGMGGASGAVVALLALFAPGLLLVAGLLPLWRRVVGHPRAAAAVAGVNAVVVGLLAAALYDPLWTSAIDTPADIAIAAIAFLILRRWQRGALPAVLWCVLASCAVTLLV